MNRVIIIENSGKVNFGGGQKVTLQVAEILNDVYELIFADFIAGTRYEKIVDEKYSFATKIHLRGQSFFFPFKCVNWCLEIIFLFLFLPSNIKKIRTHTTKKTLIYVTTKKGLLYAFLMKYIYKVPYIYHAHLVENRRSLFYPLYIKCLKHAETVFCVSQAVHNTVLQLNNAVLLYNPNLNLRGFKGYKTDKRFVVAAIGSLIEIKGFKYFVEAAKQLSDSSYIEFRIYGDGPLKCQLETFSNGCVKFMGFCEDIVSEMYKSIDIVVVPTIIPEALSLVLVEAKSVGLPVIATNIGGQAEIVRDGIDGYLVSVKDCISIKKYVEKIAHDIDLYNSLSKESYQSLSPFDYELFKLNILKSFSLLSQY